MKKRVWLAGAFLTLVTALVYHDVVNSPFLLDDIPTIVQNPSIQITWPLVSSLRPLRDSGITSAGRPLVNLTLAFNYAIGKLDPRGYHILNIFIHICTGWVLMGLTRRTLLQPEIRAHFGKAAFPLSFAIAVLWMNHPLNTESVSYIVQRTELLAGLFCLLTLYCFERGTSGGSRWWLPASLLTCLLGVASKEVGAMIPLLVFLYDRTFVSKSFSRAWQFRGKYYLMLSLAWILQLFLILSTGNRGGTAGYVSMPWWKYTLTQGWAIAHYLRLSFWPHPLIFDYGTPLVTDLPELAFPLLLILILLGVTIYCLVRYPAVGFAGAFFFIILAPSSSFVPIVSQTIAEHRMYLPEAAVVTLLVLALYRYLGKFSTFVLVTLAVIACVLTKLRNDDYETALSIWEDTARKQPENGRCWSSMGALLADQGNYPLALQLFDRASTLQPLTADVHFSAAYVLAKMGRFPEAANRYILATHLRPTYYQAYHDLGVLLFENKHYREAIECLEKALSINPEYLEAHYDLAKVFLAEGNAEAAIPHLRKAIQINPSFSPALTALDSLAH